MNIEISNRNKKECFISIFQLLKNSSLNLNTLLDKNNLKIQGMDKSHICLFNLTLDKSWFDLYEIEDEIKICFDTNLFYSIISSKSEEQIMRIKKLNEENLEIEFINNIDNDNKENKSIKDYNKYFKMNLIEYEYDNINVIESDYECNFSYLSKQIERIFTQLSNFGESVLIECNEENINFNTDSDSGNLKISIPFNDLISYEIVEEMNIKLYLNLINISKMCITSKLTNNIDFYLCNDNPMKICYNLGNNSDLIFYIAPKLTE
jgi:proliferating cell nuclear antigen PCNA